MPQTKAQVLNWANAFGDSSQSVAKGIFSDNKGNLIVVNTSTIKSGFGLRKIDAKDGSTVWFKEFSGFFRAANEIADAKGDVYFMLSNNIVKLDGSTGETIWTSLEQFNSYALAFQNKILATTANKLGPAFDVIMLSAEYGFEINRKAFASKVSLGAFGLHGYAQQYPVLSYQFINDLGSLNEITFGHDQQVIPHHAGLMSLNEDLSVHWCIPATKLISFNNLTFDGLGNAFVWGTPASQSKIGFDVDSFSCGISDRSTLFKVDLGSGRIVWHKKPNFILTFQSVSHCDEKGVLRITPAYTDEGNLRQDTTPEMRVIDPTACERDQSFEVNERWCSNPKLYAFDQEKHFFALSNILSDVVVDGVRVHPKGSRSMILVKWNLFDEVKTPICVHKAIQVFPNPAKDIITFSLQESLSAPIELRIFDAIGHPQLTATNDSYLQLDISFLPPGLYTALFTDAQGQRERIKFIRSAD